MRRFESRPPSPENKSLEENIRALKNRLAHGHHPDAEELWDIVSKQLAVVDLGEEDYFNKTLDFYDSKTFLMVFPDGEAVIKVEDVVNGELVFGLRDRETAISILESRVKHLEAQKSAVDQALQKLRKTT